MTSPAPSLDEAILETLAEEDVFTSAGIAEVLDVSERSARRRLRRLIRDGYAFSPDRGRYRITAAGLAAIRPLPADPQRDAPGRPNLATSTPRDLLDRWRGGR